MAQQHEPESEDTGIDLAPMLDFVMNLLIFFIITTSFVKEAGIQVDRGLAVTAVHKDSGNILIAIRQNGEVWMDRRRSTCARCVRSSSASTSSAPKTRSWWSRTRPHPRACSRT
jgi:biopolymer transport protein ExbD